MNVKFISLNKLIDPGISRRNIFYMYMHLCINGVWLLFGCVIILYLLSISSLGQQFVANPTILEIGLTNNLQIECTATKDKKIALTTQIRILFSNNKDQPVYHLFSLVDSFSGLYDTSEALDSGEIVGNGTSKLRLKWNYLCEIPK